MKKNNLIILAVILIISGFSVLSAESGIDWSGYFQTDNRALIKGKHNFSWHEYRLGLQMEAYPSNNTHFFSEVWLRTIGNSNTQSSSDLSEIDKIASSNLYFKEAYLDVYGFLCKDIDVRIGRQRITWGTADKLNPTDNLNPDDLEDMWDFGRHLSSDGLKATYYLGDYELSAVYIPKFTPAVLPGGEWATALSPSFDLPTGLVLRNYSDKIIMPENNLKEQSIIGTKFSGNLLNYDLSVSYIYGRDYLPLINKAKSTPVDALGTIDISAEMIFPRMHIAGFDLAGTLGNIGIWAETAVFFPEEILLSTDLSELGMGIQETIALDDEPYIKYVFGGDYTFTNGIYVNAQYLHGFIHERGTDNLEDYLMFGLEKKFFEEKLKIMPLNGGLEIKDFDDFKENYAVIFTPEITYYPYDNVELILGTHIIDGKESSTFGKMNDSDDIYFKAKVSF
ncbi:MAG: hypothetical protein DRI23_04740 [Candidatus Cloacimonadota bacterium]|nr:MAG: hypothetical protein DRI23_04740 [Candidatus Cloacimonadota bacterium]